MVMSWPACSAVWMKVMPDRPRFIGHDNGDDFVQFGFLLAWDRVGVQKGEVMRG